MLADDHPILTIDILVEVDLLTGRNCPADETGQ
jgi:hypothetical protein